MYYAHFYNASEGMDGYFEFYDRLALGRFIKWSRAFHARISNGYWLEHCTIILEDPANAISSQEIPRNIIPLKIDDELDAENWFNVFEDNDVYLANTYLEDLMTGFLALNLTNN
jgi:hypothetical protein